MIQVTNVTKTFGDFKALNQLTLHAKKGSVYGLIGPNGAGKTTILKHLAGIYTQDSGDVELFGEPVFENLSVKKRMVFISDDLFFFTTYSILDTAKYYAGIYPGWSWDRFNQLKDIFKIDVTRRVRRLSKGMQKQVAFWIGISAMPEILLLDEPVDGLDPVMRRNVWKLLLQDVAERGTTVLVSSHNLRELEDVCDHVGIMHQGQVVLEKALDDVKGNIHKLQVAFKDGFPEDLTLNTLHTEQYGSVSILIVKGDGDEILHAVNRFSPLICDILPLTLEEVFIYELGGLGYEFKNIIL
ncbi:MAG: ABC transporter ATP-binding protein [Ruminococcaceae bacterium]|nr:ABC transporter ATP-binding protein [Oscillospiraceae bacterium]